MKLIAFKGANAEPLSQEERGYCRAILEQARDDNGNLRFDQSCVNSFLSLMNKTNAPYLKILLKARDSEGKLKYNCYDIILISKESED